MTAREIERAALERYGAEAQTLMLFEEMAELQNELCKFPRGRSSREKIAEEIADVLIMLEQMEILHECEQSVSGFRGIKLARLEERLKEEANG